MLDFTTTHPTEAAPESDDISSTDTNQKTSASEATASPPSGSTAQAAGGNWDEIASDPRATLKRYLREIAPVRTLTREEEGELSQDLEQHTLAFRDAVMAIPGAGRIAIERWQTIKSEGRVSGTLSASHRDGTGRDYSTQVDRALSRMAAALDEALSARSAQRRAPSHEAARKSFAQANLSTEVLTSLYLELTPRLREMRSQATRVARKRARASSEGTRRGEERARGRSTGPASELRESERFIGMKVEAFATALGRATEARDRLLDAKNTFVRHNLKLVVAVARDFREMGVPFLDLIQEGNLGLIRAVEKFDHTRGFKFSTYAVWWIRQSFIRAIQNTSRTVRLPSQVHDQLLGYRRGLDRLTGQLGRAPTFDELREELGFDDETLERLVETQQRPLSIESPVGSDDSRLVMDVLGDPNAESPIEHHDGLRLSGALGDMIATLPERERLIVERRFGMNGQTAQTLQQIGESLGLSRERVRQIESEALVRLREQAEEQGLESILEPDDARGVDVGRWPSHPRQASF